MVLGGPTAGAWVGLLSTLESRELRTQPWYGVLANHSVMTVGAVAGGLVVQAFGPPVASMGFGEGASSLLPTMAGTFALAVVTSALAACTIMLRDDLSARELFGIVVNSFGRMTAAEIGIAWLLVVVYVAVGWWAPLLVTVGVLLLWPEEGEVDYLDPLMKVLRLRPFERAMDRTLSRIRTGLLPGGALMSLDLDGFGEINREIGYQAANEVLVEVGNRLRAIVRTTDLLARVGGDEIVLFLSGVVDPAVAQLLAERIQTAVSRPVATSYGVVQVGISIGIVMVPTASDTPSREVLKQWADMTMQAAKHAHREDPDATSIRFHSYGGGATGRRD